MLEEFVFLTKADTLEQFAKILIKIIVISGGKIKGTSKNTNAEIFRNELCYIIERSRF